MRFHWAVCVVVVLITNLVSVGLFALLTERSQTIFIATAVQVANQSKSSQKEENVFSGVLISDKALSGDEEKDWPIAENFMTPYKKWERVKCGTVPGFKDHTGFLFKIVADDEKPETRVARP